MRLQEAFKKFLLQHNYLEAEALDRAWRSHLEKPGNSFEKILIDGNFLRRTEVLKAISAYLNVPMFEPAILKIEIDILRRIPQKIMRRHRLIPLAIIGTNMTVAMADPSDIIAIDDIKNLTGLNVIPVLSLEEDILKSIENYFSEDQEIDDMVANAIEEEEVEYIEEREGENLTDDGTAASEAPVIKLVNLILKEALKKRASDIHFEAYEKSFRVRLRIDGILQQAFQPPQSMQSAVMARIKIMSDLDITERRVPQDGRFKIRLGTKEIDFRVSILPCIFGEKAVLRILDKSNLQLGLDKLGYLPQTLETFKQAIRKPYGLILVTGPTGSGKSTTLYSILNMMNSPDRNIMTIEDPIEYQVQGISQSQVKSEIGFTFAGGLRSLLRQSPDVILVGEIRDGETADIAVKAALTGHLVFSTLHTNSACGAITRLMDMGVEPFLISSALVMVAAQRLCRKICENCKEPFEIPEEVLDRLRIDKSLLKGVTPFRGKGCITCGGSGYRGRLGTIECLVLDEEIRSLILRRESSDAIQRAATAKGMKLLFDNLFTKFKMGLTTLEEVLRISSAE